MFAVVPRLWPDSTVVCIGGGPSLTPADVEACRGRARVIAINDAYRLAPWADVLYAADAKWWKHHAGVPDFNGWKFTLQAAATAFPGVSLLENTGANGLETRPTGLRSGWNSGYQAINLAVHFGARRIILLGYDMQRLPGGPSHWFGDHPAGVRAESPYQTFRELFEGILDPLRARGIEVINASRETALTCVQRMSLEDALALEAVPA